eukprot:6768897-Ditylum_brightwellii.AAC.1
MFNCFHGGSEGVSIPVGNITPQFITTGGKGIFCDLGDDFKATIVMLQSYLAPYSVHDCVECEDKDVTVLN